MRPLVPVRAHCPVGVLRGPRLRRGRASITRCRRPPVVARARRPILGVDRRAATLRYRPSVVGCRACSKKFERWCMNRLSATGTTTRHLAPRKHSFLVSNSITLTDFVSLGHFNPFHFVDLCRLGVLRYHRLPVILYERRYVLDSFACVVQSYINVVNRYCAVVQ